MNSSIGNGWPCPGYTVLICKRFSFSTLACAATESSIMDQTSGLTMLASRSPQNRSPLAVRMPIEPFECPGISRTLASNPYPEKSYPSSIYKSGLNLSDLLNLKNNLKIILMRIFCLFRFHNVSAFDHSGIVLVHGYLCTEFFPKVRCITAVVKITMT